MNTIAAGHAHDFGLSPADAAFFETHGYLGPFPLLDALEAQALGARTLPRVKAIRVLSDKAPITTEPDGQPKLWYKSTHLLIPEIAEIGLRAEIVNRIQGLIGNDLLLWGAQLIVKTSKSHRWHVDVEHAVWNGVSVWLGLQNVGPENTMKLIPGSHRFGLSPQDLARTEGVDLKSDREVLAALRRSRPETSILTLDLHPGAFFIFAGRTWHASHDISALTRTALIYQYSLPSARVRIPLSYDTLDPPVHPAQPWVMLAAGEDRFGVNHIKAPAG